MDKLDDIDDENDVFDDEDLDDIDDSDVEEHDSSEEDFLRSSPLVWHFLSLTIWHCCSYLVLQSWSNSVEHSSWMVSWTVLGRLTHFTSETEWHWVIMTEEGLGTSSLGSSNLSGTRGRSRFLGIATN